MSWAELTDLFDQTIYVNLARIVSIERTLASLESGQRAATILRTEVPDGEGRALIIFVQDAPEVVYEWVRERS